jgi:hypothetical protein
MRVTRVYRRSMNGWELVRRHADPLVARAVNGADVVVGGRIRPAVNLTRLGSSPWRVPAAGHGCRAGTGPGRAPCTPTTNHTPHLSGSSGSPLSAASCASSTPSNRPTTKTGRFTGSFTPPASGGSPPPRQHASHDANAVLRRPRGLLEPDAWKRARPVLRAPGSTNALGLPDASTIRRWNRGVTAAGLPCSDGRPSQR